VGSGKFLPSKKFKKRRKETRKKKKVKVAEVGNTAT